MHRALIILAGICVLAIALPFALGFCAFRLDAFYHFRNNPKIVDPPITVSFTPIICHEGAERYSIPGCLAPNERANGFQIQWELGGYNDSKKVLTVTDIKVDLFANNTSKPLDVPFNYWPGVYNSSKNVYYAFVSTRGYSTELPLGIYRIQLSYSANGIPYANQVTLDYAVKRRFGFHTFFYSKWF